MKLTLYKVQKEGSLLQGEFMADTFEEGLKAVFNNVNIEEFYMVIVNTNQDWMPNKEFMRYIKKRFGVPD